MAEVKVLISGTTKSDSWAAGQEESESCTMTLIKDGNMKIVVDPGVLKNQRIMINALKKEGLDVNDITHVFITHSHFDHYRNVAMFPKAKALDCWALWTDDHSESWNAQLTKDIKIIKTPGHSYDSLTFLVRTDLGIVAIIGDVYWREGHPGSDPYATDIKQLKESRKKVLEIADYIIPGHGKMFKVKK